MPENRFITAEEAQRVARVHRATLYRWAARGWVEHRYGPKGELLLRADHVRSVVRTPPRDRSVVGKRHREEWLGRRREPPSAEEREASRAIGEGLRVRRAPDDPDALEVCHPPLRPPESAQHGPEAASPGEGATDLPPARSNGHSGRFGRLWARWRELVRR